MNASTRASASKIADLFACGYPFRRDVDLVPDTMGPAALVGNAIDALVTAYVELGDITAAEAAEAAGAPVSEVRVRWEHLREWLMKNVGPGWHAQLWLVWDARTDTTRVTTRERAMKEPRSALEISCVLDLSSQTGPDVATSYDVKTGKVAGAKVEQLLTNGVALRRHFGVSTVKSGFIFAHKDGCRLMPVDFTADELDEHAARLEAYLLEVNGSQPTPGAACRFCRCAVCPPGEAHRRRMGWRK